MILNVFLHSPAGFSYFFIVHVRPSVEGPHTPKIITAVRGQMLAFVSCILRSDPCSVRKRRQFLDEYLTVLVFFYEACVGVLQR